MPESGKVGISPVVERRCESVQGRAGEGRSR